MSNAVFCIARSPAQATRTINFLLRGGFSVHAISALYRAGLLLDGEVEKLGLVTEALPTTASGAISSLWKSAGPLADALRSVTEPALATLAEKLTELGVPRFEASLYAKKTNEAGFLLAINTLDSSEAQRALDVLMDEAGAAYTCVVCRSIGTESVLHQSRGMPMVIHDRVVARAACA